MPLLASLGSMRAVNFVFPPPSGDYWIGLLGSSSYNSGGNGVTVDTLGNVYFVGSDNEYSTSYTDMYVAKYSSAGILIWQKYIRTGTSTKNDIAYSVAVDSSFNVFVVGTAFATSTISGIAVFKLDSSGTTQWQKTLYNTATTVPSAYSISLNSTGDLFICGDNYFSGYPEIYIAKITNAGVVSFQLRLGGAGSGLQIRGYGVATDASGNFYISGQDITALGKFYLAKYNSAGTLQWQHSLSYTGTGYAYGKSVVVDSSGNVFLAGFSSANGGIYCGYLFKYDSTGTLQWQRKLSASGEIAINSMCIDSSGNIYICGTMQTLSPNFHDLYVAKYNTSGVIQWQRKIGTTVDEEGLGIACSGTSIYITGFIPVGSFNYIFISKLKNDGSFIGTYTVGTTTISISAGTATDSASTLTDAISTLTAGTNTISNTSTTALTFANASLTSTVKKL